MRSGMCSAVALGLAATPLLSVAPTAQAAEVGQVVFSDMDYADADWTIVNSFATGFVGQVQPAAIPAAIGRPSCSSARMCRSSDNSTEILSMTHRPAAP